MTKPVKEGDIVHKGGVKYTVMGCYPDVKYPVKGHWVKAQNEENGDIEKFLWYCTTEYLNSRAPLRRGDIVRMMYGKLPMQVLAEERQGAILVVQYLHSGGVSRRSANRVIEFDGPIEKPENKSRRKSGLWHWLKASNKFKPQYAGLDFQDLWDKSLPDPRTRPGPWIRWGSDKGPSSEALVKVQNDPYALTGMPLIYNCPNFLEVEALSKFKEDTGDELPPLTIPADLSTIEKRIFESYKKGISRGLKCNSTSIEVFYDVLKEPKDGVDLKQLYETLFSTMLPKHIDPTVNMVWRTINTKETTMDKSALYELTSGTKAKPKVEYGNYLATNSTGQLVFEIKGTGEVKAYAKDKVKEVVPYTVRLSDRQVYETEEGKVKKGDILLMNGAIETVTDIDIKLKGSFPQLTARRVMTEDL